VGVWVTEHGRALYVSYHTEDSLIHTKAPLQTPQEEVTIKHIRDIRLTQLEARPSSSQLHPRDIQIVSCAPTHSERRVWDHGGLDANKRATAGTGGG